MTRKHLTITAACVAVGAGLITGCGSDSSDGAASSASTVTETATAAATSSDQARSDSTTSARADDSTADATHDDGASSSSDASGTGSTADSTGSATATSGEVPDEKNLADQTGDPYKVVKVGAGYEAMSYGSVAGSSPSTALGFYRWHSDSGSWKKAGSVTAPNVLSGSVSVAAGRLSGSNHATFVLKGAFTGNETGSAYAFGYDLDNGWGVLTAQSDGSLAAEPTSADNRSKGLEVDINIVDGRLQTKSLWGADSEASNAEQATNPVVRTFRADGNSDLLTGTTRPKNYR